MCNYITFLINIIYDDQSFQGIVSWTFCSELINEEN